MRTANGTAARRRKKKGFIYKPTQNLRNGKNDSATDTPTRERVAGLRELEHYNAETSKIANQKRNTKQTPV